MCASVTLVSSDAIDVAAVKLVASWTSAGEGSNNVVADGYAASGHTRARVGNSTLIRIIAGFEISIEGEACIATAGKGASSVGARGYAAVCFQCSTRAVVGSQQTFISINAFIIVGRV